MLDVSTTARPGIKIAQPLLRVEDVSKNFGAVRALHNVSLALHPGEIRAICGENGAGKSTLVKILTGIVVPDSGTVRIDGQVRLLPGPRAAQQAGINLVTQELSVCPDLSVLDNIWLGTIGVPLIHRRRRLRERARQVLADLGAGNIHLDTPVARLSTGERQIVEIARMLNRDTRILILDEPTATLSDQEISRVMAALRAVRSTGKSIVYITHRLGEVFDLCDSVTVLRNGEVVGDCEVGRLDRQSLIETMLGRALGEMYPEHTTIDDVTPVLTIRGLNIPGLAGPVDLDVQQGQVVCLTGQVGSGADAVVRAVCGLVPSATGNIAVGGAPLPMGSPERAFMAGVRFVSGDRATEGIFVDQTVADNLTATRILRRGKIGILNGRALRAEAERLAQAVRIDRLRLSSVALELSGGNQQKIAFGRNIADPDAKVLVMIEPTRGIDVGARAEIYRLMRTFCEEGYGVLVASTDFGEVLGLGDLIVTMYRGSIVGRHSGATATMPRIIADVTHPEILQ